MQTIKAADIATVRKLGKPPYLIMLIMDAVCIYFKRKLEPVSPDFDKKFFVTSWTESLRVCITPSRIRLNDGWLTRDAYLCVGHGGHEDVAEITGVSERYDQC